jgi:hypothetical protein
MGYRIAKLWVKGTRPESVFGGDCFGQIKVTNTGKKHDCDSNIKVQNTCLLPSQHDAT